ncbi:MAG: Wzz/FepE/Etk N-terminal domain-containing protein [Pseudomonadota bacterium]
MNSANQESKAVTPSEIDLGFLLGVLWAGKWLIVGITSAISLIAVIVALLLPNEYRAAALLAPNEQQNAGGLSSLASQFGGLASLASIDLGSGAIEKTDLGLEVLQSRKFITEFISKHDILVPLMATKGWNAETGELLIDPDDFDVETSTWVRDVRAPKKTVPSDQEAYEEFMEHMSVIPSKKSGLVSVAVIHYSPDVARQWVDWLVADLNLTIMRRDVAEAEQAIEYLNQQIANTSVSNLQSVFFSLIEEQTKTVMLAKVSDEYLFKTVDPAVAPEEKSKPRRALIVFLGAFLGLLTAVISCFGLHVLSSSAGRSN